jgi:hypothetical protein
MMRSATGRPCARSSKSKTNARGLWNVIGSDGVGATGFEVEPELALEQLGHPEVLIPLVAAPAAGQTISGTRRCATANSKSHSSSTSACAS